MEQQGHTGTALVPAAFARRDRAETAIGALRDLGFSDDELGVAVPEAVLQEAALDIVGAEEFRGTARGFVLGAPVGSLAGIALRALVAGGLGPLGVGGLLISATAGALWGMVLGGYAGLAAKVHQEEEVGHWTEIPLGDEDILLVVRAGTRERVRLAHDVVLAHGGRCFCLLDHIAGAHQPGRWRGGSTRQHLAAGALSSG